MKQLIKSVLQVMEAVENIDKSMNVGSGSNSYKGTSDKDVKIAFNKAMRDAKLIILPIKIEPKTTIDRWEEVDQWSKMDPKPMKTKQSIFTEVVTTYLLAHESGETVELQGYGHGVDPQDKSAGKATTYALKYALLYSFLTPTGTIDDADKTHSDSHEIPKAQQPARVLPFLNPEDQKWTDAISKKTPLETVLKYFRMSKASQDLYNSQLNKTK